MLLFLLTAPRCPPVDMTWVFLGIIGALCLLLLVLLIGDGPKPPDRKDFY